MCCFFQKLTPLIVHGLLLLTPLTTIALPTESFESWGMSKKSKNFGWVQMTRQTPLWVSTYETAEMTYGWGQKHPMMVGVQGTVKDDDLSRRFSYFFRYDYVLTAGHSLNIKYIHEDLYFIQTGKESIGLSYNSFLGSGKSGLYYTVGYYHRWLKQFWNTQAHIPLTFDTQDHEGFVQGTFGIQWDFGSALVSLDINNRDAFHFYGGDHWAIDLKANLSMGQKFSMALLMGSRFSGFGGLTGFPSNQYFALRLEY